MRIEVGQKIKPFSHCPGTTFILPRTHLKFKIFPAKIFVDDLSTSQLQKVAEIDVAVKGPVSGFTIEQDLEKGRIRVWGNTLSGFMRYSIYPRGDSFALKKEKTPEEGFAFSSHERETVSDADPKDFEILSLGNNKAQDWAMIKRRSDLTEIFPIWFRLGQMIPNNSTNGTFSNSLLSICENLIKENNRLLVPQAFKNLFHSGFDLGLSPRLIDACYQGFPHPPLPSHISPLFLLTYGYQLIRSLFIQQSNESSIAILPCLPPDFHCGRLNNIRCGTNGKCDIEWTKKVIRRMIFTAEKSENMHFQFQSLISHFRLRLSDADIGKKIAAGQSIEVEKGQRYYFDNFMK